MSDAPHDHDAEFAARERLCAALYDASQACVELAFVVTYDFEREDAAKRGMRLRKLFEAEWRMYGYRKHQARTKGMGT